MTRHGRNATANSVYSYHERQKDLRESGYGTIRERLSKDAIKGFDCCCLTLQSCKEPVVTPQGYLYDKEAILECILHQKKDHSRKLKEWRKEQEEDEEFAAELIRKEHSDKVKRFVSYESTPTVRRTDDDDVTAAPSKSRPEDHHVGTGIGGVSNMLGEKRKMLPSFWMPDQLPHAKKTKIDKPVPSVICPMSKLPIKMKDLIPIHFTPVDDHKKTRLGDLEKWKCEITQDTLTNSMSLAVLRKSGAVVKMDAVINIVRKDMIDPIAGVEITDDDIIPLKRGGTGYAATNEGLSGSRARPMMELC